MGNKLHEVQCEMDKCVIFRAFVIMVLKVVIHNMEFIDHIFPAEGRPYTMELIYVQGIFSKNRPKKCAKDRVISVFVSCGIHGKHHYK